MRSVRFFLEHAKAIQGNGYSVHPIPRGKKAPPLKGHTRYGRVRPDGKTIERWSRQFPDHGVAIPCGLFAIAIDIDEEDENRADQIDALVVRHLGPTTMRRYGNRPRRVLVYRSAVGELIRSSRCGKVEVLGDGRYFVAFNEHPGTKQPYEWPDDSPLSYAQADLTTISQYQIENLLADLKEIYCKKPDLIRIDSTIEGASLLRDRVPTHPNWIIGHTGLVVDGRDSFLASKVFGAFASGVRDAVEIAALAWSIFEQAADLVRPKRDGTRPWSIQDARCKARALLASGKPRPPHRRRRDGCGFWTPAVKRAFLQCTDAAGACRQLSPKTVAVSRLMLTYVEDDGDCFASVATLARRLECSTDTIKKARRVLRLKGFWLSSDEEVGGRGKLAHYRPNPSVLDRIDPFAQHLDEIENWSSATETALLETVDAKYTRNIQLLDVD